VWTNPFNGVKSYVSYQDVRFIVFWSKNPKSLLNHLDYLKSRRIGCYIQFTLNDYEKDGLEPRVPKLNERIDSFKLLVEALGLGHVIWRFDPLILTDEIDIDMLITKIEHIGNQLQGYTEKLVFSFVDILGYRKVKVNLEKNNIHFHEWTESKMFEFSQRLSTLNKKWGYTLATCAEKVDLKPFGINHNKCIDDKLITRLAYTDKKLMDFLKVKFHPIPSPDIFGEAPQLPAGAIILPNGMYASFGASHDNGQRRFCGCVSSKDIGEYNTCMHLCKYCYANTSEEAAIRNFERHCNDPESTTITGV
jgi:DNA repair photolyase